MTTTTSPSGSAATDVATVLVEEESDGAVVRLTLNRPEKLNALNEALRGELQVAVDDLAERPSVRIVVIGGAGRAFSAGADLGERTDPLPDELSRRHASGRWQRLLDSWERLPQVTVARLHGHVIGGAALLAAASDLRVAGEDVSISIPEVAVGIPLAWAGLPRLAREIGMARTRDLVMTGRRVGGPEAERWGLVNQLVPDDDLDGAVSDMVAELLAQPAVPLAMTVDGLRSLGRSLSPTDAAWSDPDLLRWSLRQR